MEIASIISFALKMSAITMVIWLFWFAFLRNVTQFSLVRVFLVGGLISSMLLPLAIPFFQELLAINVQNIGINASYMLKEVVIISGKNSFDWWRLISIAYVIITSALIIRFTIQLARIALLVYNNKVKSILCPIRLM